jgi:hypothetical protein
MCTILSRGEDGALSDALAGILGRLRGHPYGPFPGGPEEDLRREADEFIVRLAGHLRYAEDTIFPALQEGGPGSESDLEELEKEHRLLGLYARDLAIEIRDQDRKKGYEVARVFLAVLLHHIHRETKGVV